MIGQKCPSSLAVGTVLYSAYFNVDYPSGKVSGDIYEEVVRSIKRSPNTGNDSKKYVHVVRKIDGVTWVDTTKPPATRYGKKTEKTEGWASSIPSYYRTKFVLSDNLPMGFCTTRLLAIKSAISGIKRSLLWYDAELAIYRKDGTDQKHIDELIKEKQGVERSLTLAKSFLTKEKNKREKATK
ncbi:MULTISPECIES: hypothetical protein [Enterobacterales]|uniref:Uncharacterized protein n=6 Tax=Enterobacterales TaxID=91347 RepID=Q8KK47_PROVU|nr:MULTISPECIES: hypothetical protein [Enterobacterales]ELB1214747.1 hypothetical protein [Proteus mirabilis]ELY4881572.1 hypothetical protein [Morganella morganii]SPY66431.1 Uncharacterised protein [Providencia stuartii]HAZ7869396.1 hypothetical protein [Escherichia coli]ELR5094374.1 hypothetical protein [Providencia rettgeri]